MLNNFSRVVRCQCMAVLMVGALIAIVNPIFAQQEQDNTPSPVILNPDLKLTVQSYSLNVYEPKLDGQWLGAVSASDGKAYFSSSTHSHDTAAKFFQYDPQTRLIHELIPDASIASGENAKTMIPQGKLHSNVVEMNGWLYMGTHLANYWSSAMSSYTGSHLLRYQLGSYEAGAPVVQNLGITRANYTNYWGLSADPVHQYVYTWATRWWGQAGSYLYRYNADGSNKTLLGSFVSATNMSQFVDSQGDMWFCHSSAATTMYRVNGSTGTITTYANVMPGGVFDWGQKIGDDRYIGSINGKLYEFDASIARGGNVSGAFKLVYDIKSTGLSKAVSGNILFFVRSANPSVTTSKASDHHLYSIDLTNPSAGIVDWGRIVDQDGRTPWRIEGMAADELGNLFMVGDWRLLKDELGNLLESGTVRHNDSVPGTYYYDDMWRGQFFATVNVVPEPASLSLLALGAGCLFMRQRRHADRLA